MKSILIGLDAFDPIFFENLHNQGKTPNLSKYVTNGEYSRFEITNPAQSEVSWTSIATGQNPGGHGIFDFVHRNPKTYGIEISLLQSRKSLVGLQFAPPHSAETIFDHAIDHGYPATSLWWPATFPARLTSPIFSIPGLGTPDITGKLGVGIFFSQTGGQERNLSKTQKELLTKTSQGVFTGTIPGPKRVKGNKVEETSQPFTLKFLNDSSAQFSIGKKISFTLKIGDWSPVFEINFKMGLLISLKTVTRVILTGTSTDPQVYFLPLQIHPLSSAWPYGSPRNLIAKTWKENGPFLTLGWPQDTTGLEEGILSDNQFLTLCDSIITTREQIFLSQLDRFNEGVLGIVFDTLDRVQHMFWKTRPDIIEQWYLKLDALVGRIEDKINSSPAQGSQVLVLSDHGFKNFEYKVNLNKWLLDNGYLSVPDPQSNFSLDDVSWTSSKAYAVGLNSLYLNQQGRESQGIVSQSDQEIIQKKLKQELLNWTGPDGNKVIETVQTNQEALDGPLAYLGPDMLIGYAPGYRGSADTGVGKWNENSIEKNSDHWGADHCINPGSVQGVLFRNKGLSNYPTPSYRDIPPMVVGSTLKPGSPPDVDYSEEDRETVEERLKGLGYL